VSSDVVYPFLLLAFASFWSIGPEKFGVWCSQGSGFFAIGVVAVDYGELEEDRADLGMFRVRVFGYPLDCSFFAANLIS